MTNPETTAPSTDAAILSAIHVIWETMTPVFKWQHLNPDVILGFIGNRGGGKSLGGAYVTLVDNMLQGIPCYSNVRISAKFKVNNINISYEAKELEMVKFLRFDDAYEDTVFFIDEINVALADARRSMTNQNIGATDVGQQLRKLRASLVYTSIHEMFVESRIRDMTDIFINTEDMAISPGGLAARIRPGHNFLWTIYDMNGKLTGVPYSKSKTPLHLTFHGGELWGLVDTFKRQERGKYDMKKLGEVNIGDNPELEAANSKWGWLYDAILELHNDGYDKIHNKALWEYLQLEERGVDPVVVGRQLGLMGISKKQAPYSIGGAYYFIDQFDLEKTQLSTQKEAMVSPQ